jgi:hypothetical protein
MKEAISFALLFKFVYNWGAILDKFVQNWGAILDILGRIYREAIDI